VSIWRDLEAALDAAARRGEMIRLWWRDDDAGRSDPALARLLELAERHSVPIALAVVPLWLDAGVQGRIAASAQTTVLQHGYAHASHAPAGQKPCELGYRDLAAILAELRRGKEILVDAFGAAFLAVLVPPWNRLDPAVIGYLAESGFHGLSAFGRRKAAEAAPGLPQVNTHLDPIAWRGSRLFIGEAAALGCLIELLGPDEPIGLLSHHLDADEAGWQFLDRLLGILTKHPAARFCTASYLFEKTA
jgi:hypothetical protein